MMVRWRASSGWSVWTILPVLCLITLSAAQPTDPMTKLTLDYRNMTGADQAGQQLSDIQNGRSPSGFIDIIEIKGYNAYLRATQLNEALRRLPRPITEFHYDMKLPITRELLNVLETHHPAARLYYTMPLESFDILDFNDPDEDQRHRLEKDPRLASERDVIGSTNLYSLTADITYADEDNYHDLPLVHEIIVRAPNLRELDLSVHHGGGCIVASYPYAFNFAKDRRPFPDLEVLKLNGYRMYSYSDGDSDKWGSRSDWRRHLAEVWQGRRSLFHWAPDYERAEEPYNLRAWLGRMDWSKLRHLELDSFSAETLALIGAELASLEHLEVSSAESRAANALPSFLRNLTQPLRHLSVQDVLLDGYDDLLSAASDFGDRLVHFTLAERESSRLRYCYDGNVSQDICPSRRGTYHLDRPFLNASQIEQLSARNPSIKALQIDIPRFKLNLTSSSIPDATWSFDHEVVRAAARCPGLTHLQLNTESPDRTLVRADVRAEGKYSTARLSGAHGGERGIESFMYDPSFNRSSVAVLFHDLNAMREIAGLPPLHELVVKVGRFEMAGEDWGMLEPPHLLVGKWMCVREVGEQKCMGGNGLLGWGSGYGLQDPYSEDWSQPDNPSGYLFGDDDFNVISDEDVQERRDPYIGDAM